MKLFRRSAQRFLVSLLAGALFLSPEILFAEPLYVNIETGRFRSGPGTAYQVLWTAHKFTPLEYLAKYQKWYAVRDYEGDVAWVHELAVAIGEAAIVSNSKANIRSGPATSYDILYTVKKGYPFKVIEKKGEWYKVTDVQGDTGWVLDQLVWVSR